MKISILIFRVAFLLLGTLLYFSPLQMSAKKVVCIAPPTPGDDGGNGFLSSHEGWEWDHMSTGDTIMNCADTTALRACMDQVANGDELVIIGHGAYNGAAFVWGNDTIWGFGNGPGQMPASPGWSGVNNVKLRFCTCWSANKHDPTGTYPPMVDDLANEFGSVTSKEGFKNKAFASACLKITCDAWYLPKSVRDAIAMFAWIVLENGDYGWHTFPPDNKIPAAPLSSREAAENYINNILAPFFSVTVEVFYKQPYDSPNATGGYGIINGRKVYGSTLNPGSLSEWMHDNRTLMPWIDVNNNMLPSLGVYHSLSPLNFYLTESNQPIRINNIRLGNLSNQIVIPPIGNEESVSNTVTASFDISYDEGHSYSTVMANGNLDLLISQIETGLPPDSVLFSMTPVILNLVGLPPNEDITLVMEPIIEPSGYGIMVEDAGFKTGSSFTAAYALIKDGFAPAVSAMPISLVFNCMNPVTGCTNAEAINYDPCAFEDDGSCQMPILGCTYPEASNYDSDAHIEDGSCLFELEDSCVGDLNGDALVNTTDLLQMLTVFGFPCD